MTDNVIHKDILKGLIVLNDAVKIAENNGQKSIYKVIHLNSIDDARRIIRIMNKKIKKCDIRIDGASRKNYYKVSISWDG